MAAVGFKVTKGRFQKGNNFRFGPDWPGQRCGAKTRKGTPCQRPAYKRNGRCSLHGGRSTGPKTDDGLARLTAARTTHGKYTKEKRAKAKRFAEQGRQMHAELAELEAWFVDHGHLDKNWR
ncbi:MAG: HGGxSTG domain-containing protein, partial [Paracoccaceae bacterium]|nr:HGGxSTG domain-containing protein [Paracoccaceae bacterium]